MMSIRRTTFLAWLLVLVGRVLSASGATESEERSVLIENVGLVDVVRGQIVEPRSVLIRDGRIARIAEASGLAVPANALRIDGRGRYLMPGLVDMHVHLFNNFSHRPPNEWMFPLFVANGVTAVREMWTEPAELPIISRWRLAVTRGELIGPRVLAAGVAIHAQSIEEARRQVREAHRAGADFIKIYSEVEGAQWRAILAEARQERMPVCGHIPAGISVLTAAKEGQRTDEHLMQVYEACSSGEKEFLASRQDKKGEELASVRDAQEREVLDTYDQQVCDRTAAVLARTRQVQVPTLVLPHFEARETRVEFKKDPRWRYLRTDEQTRWEKYLPGETDKLAPRRWEVSSNIAKTLHRAGVPLLAGTDTPMPLVYPGWSLHKELELLVEVGLTPAEALRAATIGPAEFLGVAKNYGSIAVGKWADLVLLDDNPFDQITNTQRIHGVILSGRYLDRSALDRLVASNAE